MQAIMESGGLQTLASNVKGRETKFLVSYNLISGNQQHVELRPQCEVVLSQTFLGCVRNLGFILFHQVHPRRPAKSFFSGPCWPCCFGVPFGIEIKFSIILRRRCRNIANNVSKSQPQKTREKSFQNRQMFLIKSITSLQRINSSNERFNYV